MRGYPSKPVGVVGGHLGTDLDLPLIYLKGYDRLSNQQSNQINLFIIPLPSCPNLAFSSLLSHLFDSTSSEDVLGGLPIPRQTLASLFFDGVPHGGQIQVLFGERRRLCTHADRPAIRHGPSDSTQRRTRSCHKSWIIRASAESTITDTPHSD
jgi:hypothetical protein